MFVRSESPIAQSVTSRRARQRAEDRPNFAMDNDFDPRTHTYDSTTNTEVTCTWIPGSARTRSTQPRDPRLEWTLSPDFERRQHDRMPNQQTLRRVTVYLAGVPEPILLRSGRLQNLYSSDTATVRP